MRHFSTFIFCIALLTTYSGEEMPWSELNPFRSHLYVHCFHLREEQATIYLQIVCIEREPEGSAEEVV